MFSKSKRLISCLLCLTLMFGLFGTLGLTAADADISGSGYEPVMSVSELVHKGENAVSGSAYTVSTMDELYALAEYINSGKPSEGAIFYLTEDIKLKNCSGEDKDDRLWSPIGTETAPFRGIFDGCGYAVLNFDAVNAGDCFALFGYVTGTEAIVKNLGVEGNVTCGDNSGGIVAVLNGASVLNSWSAVDINGGDVIGGIVGSVIGGSIQNCCNYGYISGGSYAAAIAGTASENAVIEYSYYVYYSADKAVGAKSYGCTESVYRFASSSSEVLLETEVTVGKEHTDDLIVLLNSWIEQQNAGDNVYREWLYDTSNKSVKRTDGRYPSHRFPNYVEPVPSIYTETATMTALYESGIDGIAGSFYSISNHDELVYFRDYVNAGHATEGMTFYLNADISIALLSASYETLNWVPIANDANYPFRGIFDGQGYVITDLFSTESSSYQGFFGYVDGGSAQIKNVGIIGSISGNDRIGGIVSILVNGAVTNCWFDGHVTGDDYIGGIVGIAEGGVISNCVTFAAVTGDQSVGAIVGSCKSSASVKNCYYTNDNLTGCGGGGGTLTTVVGFSKNGSDFTLDRSVVVGSASGYKLLNVLNHWVEYLSTDNSFRYWKIDDSADGIARIQGNHPTHFYPGDSSGVKYVSETSIDVDNSENPYSVIYAETATMTELYESGEDVIAGGHYSISSGDELQLLALYVNEGHSTKDATFYLTKDIDITVQCLGNDAKGWLPIGCDYTVTDLQTITRNFRGDFDGCGYTVSGLYIYDEKGDNVGLFGRVRGSTIKNLGVTGGIVGEYNCGGIVGDMDDGSIINCWSSVSIQSESETGGIAGRILNTTIENCATYGAYLSVGGEDCTAGCIVGDARGKSVIKNCYYTESSINTGVYSPGSGTVVTDVLPFTYGFENDDYYCTLERAITIDDVVTSSVLDALNAWVYLQNNGQYCSWENSAVIISIENGTSGHFPVLQNPTERSDGKNDDYSGDYDADSSMGALWSTGSDGVEGNCYSINGLDDLEALRKYVNSGHKTENITFFMTRDIDMSVVYSVNTDKSWEPIGNVNTPFQGIFDGQGYTIKYLYINTLEEDQGLFGHVNKGALIKNLGISGVVNAGTNAGAIVGDFNFSTIANCWSSCEVTTTGANAGGIVGGANMGTIVNCTNYGLVIGSSAYGAIAGYAAGTTIKYCYYLYASCQEAYSGTPIAIGVQYFNGTSAACILHEVVSVEGTETKNCLAALKLYVDAHPETNYCYWTVGNTQEYLLQGVEFFPVLISASGTMGETDYKEVQAYYNGVEYYSLVKAVNAANDSPDGGDVTLATNVVLSAKENFSLDENVRVLTGDYTLNIKSTVSVYSMQQLNGYFILNKDGGSIKLWDSSKNDYALFMHSKVTADLSCNSQFFGNKSLTFKSSPAKADDFYAYNLSFQDGEFIVNSTLDSGNPHGIPANSTITLEQRATLTVSANARIRTTGGAVINNTGTVKIGNVTLDRNGGIKMKGVFEDSGGVVTLPYIYRDGYTLRGWSDGTTLYPAGGKVDAQTAITLKAEWRIGDGADTYPGDDAFGDDGEPVYDIPITVIQSNGGTISPESVMAAKGQNLTFTVKADLGYTIKNVLVDGESVELNDDNEYSFVSISGPHTIVALYAPITNAEYYDWKNTYVDIRKTDWYYDSVAYVSSANLFNGIENHQFAPEMNMKREMVVVVLWRLAGCPIVPDNGQIFTDISKDNYAYDAVRWGNYFGIVLGMGDGTFGFGLDVTREQLVTFMFRFAKNYAGDDVSLYDNTNILGYTDALEISKGMTQPFQWAVGAGLVNGTTTTTLSPKDPTTRAQVATILMRYCNRFIHTVPVVSIN